MNTSVVTIVIVAILAWFALIAFVFALLLVKFTLNRDKPNPHAGETFAMPPGVFRGILTLSVLFVVLLLEGANIGLLREDAAQWETFQKAIQPLVIGFQMILSFYFGGKIVGQLANADRDKSKNRVEAVKAMAESTPKTGITSDTNAVG